jgi:hypothetical protein
MTMDIASGASIVLVQSGVFAVVLAWESLRKKAAQRLVHVHID